MQKKKFTVLFVSTSYPADNKDWRGRFTANTVAAISHNDCIRLNIWAPPGDLPENVKDTSIATEAEWLKQLMVQGGIAHLLRSRGPFAADTVFKLLLYLKRLYKREKNIDVAHINWLQNAIPLWHSTTPTVISVLGSDLGFLKFPGMKFFLRHVIRKRKCIIAPNADWMVSELQPVFGDIAEIRSVPFGVDKMWFNIKRKPINREKNKWLVITRLTQKKIGTLFEWGKHLFKNSFELHLFGPMQENLQVPNWIVYHGPVSPDDLHAKWFPTSSGLITLSLHDEGRPQVMLEAMAAGLPVIASPLKAHIDIIDDKQTGCIVSTPKELEQALIFLSNPITNNNIGENAKRWIVKNIGTWDDCATRYINIYQTLMSELI